MAKSKWANPQRDRSRSNTGGTNVDITKSKPPLGGAFAATTTLSEGTTIAPGETLTEAVAFKPTASGPATGVWLINGDHTTGLHEVAFSGTGTLPPALLGTSEQLTLKNTSSAGWYDLVLPSPLKLAAGNYWIGVMTGATSYVAGFRYDSVTGSRDYNPNTYTSGPTNPFGTPTVDAEQASLYATYAPG